mgnify:FL=1
MKYCEKCRVSVPGDLRTCPLCQGDLSGQGEPGRGTFPALPAPKHPHRGLLQLIGLGTIAAAAVCIAVNLSLPQSGWWSVFVVAGVISFWLTFWVVVKKRGNIPKTILWQVGLISALALFWDWWTGGRLSWSVDFVIPLLLTGAMIAMAVIARVMRLKIQDYILYLMLDAIFGFIPFVLLLCGSLRVVYPSAACVAISIISLAALCLYEGKAMKNEILRRLHL